MSIISRILLLANILSAAPEFKQEAEPKILENQQGSLARDPIQKRHGALYASVVHRIARMRRAIWRKGSLVVKEAIGCLPTEYVA